MQTLNPTPTTTPQGGGKGLNTKPETHNPPPHHTTLQGGRGGGGGLNPKPTTTPQGDERGLNNPRKQPHHPDHPHHRGAGGQGSIIGPVRGGNHGGGGGGGGGRRCTIYTRARATSSRAEPARWPRTDKHYSSCSSQREMARPVDAASIYS